MYLVILWLPLMSAIVCLIMGRWVGRVGAAFTSVVFMILTWINVLLIAHEVLYDKADTYVRLWTWIMGDLGLQYDGLTAVMIVVVTSISLLVHLYSIEYMWEDPHLPRFMGYLGLFTWFMIVLVTADNMIQLFVGWEGVGLCSYLLINYWFTIQQANKAAMKAMIVNRIGDVGVVLAIVISYVKYKSVEYSVIFTVASGEEVEWIGYMLIVGAAGKSAQIGLHTWLPDAMAGPTPVSALIHAATMVTAGVFILLRCSPLLLQSGSVQSCIVIVGAVTAFFAATVGLVQNDIKKVIAYSTCSQLGYMVFACGVGFYGGSLFHLFNHAFFKALLFMSAGAVIHAMGDEQDIRKMGGIRGRQPFTYSVMLIGTFSLMGIPYMSGFYSKDGIIEMSAGAYSIAGSFGQWLGTLSAMLTAFYGMRILNICFIQDSLGNPSTYLNSKEPGYAISLPLMLLAIASIYIGYVMRDVMIGPGTPYLEFDGGYVHSSIEAEGLTSLVKWSPVILSLCGSFYAMFRYPRRSASLSKKWYTFVSNKWHVDQVYNKGVVGKILALGHTITYKIVDRGLIESLGPTGIVKLIGLMVRKTSGYQTGQLGQYSMGIILGTVCFIVLSSLEV